MFNQMNLAESEEIRNKAIDDFQYGTP